MCATTLPYYIQLHAVLPRALWEYSRFIWSWKGMDVSIEWLMLGEECFGLDVVCLDASFIVGCCHRSCCCRPWRRWRLLAALRANTAVSPLTTRVDSRVLPNSRVCRLHAHDFLYNALHSGLEDTDEDLGRHDVDASPATVVGLPDVNQLVCWCISLQFQRSLNRIAASAQTHSHSTQSTAGHGSGSRPSRRSTGHNGEAGQQTSCTTWSA